MKKQESPGFSRGEQVNSFAAALALGTVYPVTQWEAAIRRVQDILEDAEEQP